MLKKSHVMSQPKDYFDYWSFSGIKGKCCYRLGLEHATPKCGTLVRCFKLKEFEKWQVLKGLSTLLPWSRSWDSHVRGFSPHPEGRSILISENEWTGFVKFPQSTTHSLHHFCPITYSHKLLLFIKPSIKTLRFNCFFGFHFLIMALRSHKTYIKYICMLFYLSVVTKV